jgi:cytochrome c-type biogenesis protein CcmH/NrfG
MRNNIFWLCLVFCGYFLFNPTLNVFSRENEKINEESKLEAFQHYVDGDLFELSKDYSSALAEYQKAVSLAPNNPEIRFALAQAYLMIKDVESAKREALQIVPKDARTHKLLGDCYRVTGQDDSAIVAYSIAVQQDSTDISNLWHLAVLYQLKGDINQAINYWKMVAYLQPFSPQVYLQLASLFLQNGNLDEAIPAYKKVLDLQPDNLKAIGGLA